jgi:hypothetical protein
MRTLRRSNCITTTGEQRKTASRRDGYRKPADRNRRSRSVPLVYRTFHPRLSLHESGTTIVSAAARRTHRRPPSFCRSCRTGSGRGSEANAVNPLEENTHKHTETPRPTRGRGVSGSGARWAVSDPLADHQLRIYREEQIGGNASGSLKGKRAPELTPESSDSLVARVATPGSAPRCRWCCRSSGR